MASSWEVAPPPPGGFGFGPKSLVLDFHRVEDLGRGPEGVLLEEARQFVPDRQVPLVVREVIRYVEVIGHRGVERVPPLGRRERDLAEVLALDEVGTGIGSDAALVRDVMGRLARRTRPIPETVVVIRGNRRARGVGGVRVGVVDVGRDGGDAPAEGIVKS